MSEDDLREVKAAYNRSASVPTVVYADAVARVTVISNVARLELGTFTEVKEADVFDGAITATLIMPVPGLRHMIKFLQAILDKETAPA